MVGALEGVINKFDLKGQTLGEVALGAVIKHSSDWSLARECAIESGLSLKTPGIDLQRACGTSLQVALIRLAMHRSFTRRLIAISLWRSIAHIRRWSESSQF